MTMSQIWPGRLTGTGRPCGRVPFQTAGPNGQDQPTIVKLIAPQIGFSMKQHEFTLVFVLEYLAIYLPSDLASFSSFLLVQTKPCISPCPPPSTPHTHLSFCLYARLRLTSYDKPIANALLKPVLDMLLIQLIANGRPDSSYWTPTDCRRTSEIAPTL